MRVPLSWLREYVELAADATPEDVLAALVTVGFEEEDVHRFEISGPVVVGQVLSIEPEPQSNGKTINWCQVDVGSEHGGVRGIVCGAHNFIVGDKVIVTLPGAVLPGPFPIAARKTYGHVSDGMIASARELGLGDEHNGILVLSDLGIDAPVGADAIALLGLDDVAVEINVTPDRGYAFSLRGVAREYAHATGAAFRDPAERDFAELQPGSGHTAAVDDQAPVRGNVGASEFVTRVVRDVDPSRPTPPWMIARLSLAGMRSLGVLIDITNYVMLELGQPLHGYDLDKLTGGITVRRATPGEKMTTLDGVERDLHVEDLLITDESGPIGLAGVMGGGTTEMGDTTKNVLIEAAIFDPTTIARTARRHKLPSEASKRFERGVDPLIPFVAARRAADLMVELAGGTLTEEGGALFAEIFVAEIELPRGFVQGLIGVDYTDDEITGALTTIGAEVNPSTGSGTQGESSGTEGESSGTQGESSGPQGESGWTVIPPTWRPDLTDKWTLAEEVARIHGLDRIPSVLPTPPSSVSVPPARCELARMVSFRPPGAASPRTSRGVAEWRTPSRPQASSRPPPSRSRPRRRTTCTARRPASTCRASAWPTRSTDRCRSCGARSSPGCCRPRTATSRAASPTSRSSRPVSCSSLSPVSSTAPTRSRRWARARRIRRSPSSTRPSLRSTATSRGC